MNFLKRIPTAKARISRIDIGLSHKTNKQNIFYNAKDTMNCLKKILQGKRKYLPTIHRWQMCIHNVYETIKFNIKNKIFQPKSGLVN